MQHASRCLVQPATAQHMMGSPRKTIGTLVIKPLNSVTVLTVVIVIDNVGGFTQMPSKNAPQMDLPVAAVAKQTTG